MFTGYPQALSLLVTKHNWQLLLLPAYSAVDGVQAKSGSSFCWRFLDPSCETSGDAVPEQPIPFFSIIFSALMFVLSLWLDFLTLIGVR